LALAFAICVAFGVLFKGASIHQVWLQVLAWITWPSFGLGLIEAFAYGWFVAAIFGPIFNYFSARESNRRNSKRS
tara:strand:- start:15544 stop:15768 length:225 start_codon:yes stop_codon:yes gene_type:complete